MRYPGNAAAVGFVAGAVLLAACGGEDPGPVPAEARDVAAVRASVADLSERIDRLKQRVAGARAAQRRSRARLRGVAGDLEGRVKALRASLDEIADAADGAAANASAALGEAQAAARDVAVLGNRLDYHLRQGGP